VERPRAQSAALKTRTLDLDEISWAATAAGLSLARHGSAQPKHHTLRLRINAGWAEILPGGTPAKPSVVHDCRANIT
jgi:hypothetical protein